MPTEPQRGGVAFIAGMPLPDELDQGFEIVDKRTGKEVFLNGPWAQAFRQQIAAWKRTIPTQEQVEEMLDGYAGLAQHPVVVH